MEEPFKKLVTYHTAEYGRICVKLAQLLQEKGITRNRLHTLTGIKYDVITRYYRASEVEWVDLDFIAKVCFVLDCRVEDLLAYEPPEEVHNKDVHRKDA